MTNRRTLPAAVLLGSAVFFAACGSGAGSSSAPAAQAAASTASSAESTTTTATSGPATPTAAAVAAPEPSNPGGACRLLTTAEVEKAIKPPVTAPVLKTLPPYNGLGLEACLYNHNGDNQAVTVGIYTYNNAPITSALFGQFRQAQGKPTVTVSGVGDEAFEIDEGYEAKVFFRTGSKAAMVQLGGGSDKTRNDRLLELSRAAAGRL